jgi:hypothetical protein
VGQPRRSPLEEAWAKLVRVLPVEDGIWRYSRAPRKSDPTRGWKLHLSATVLTAPEVFARTAAPLRAQDVLFKVPARLEFLAALNSGVEEYSQVGKFLTVYPRDQKEAVQLASTLQQLTRDLRGPRIPFDLRYRRDGIVYYRYATSRNEQRRRRVEPPIADPFRASAGQPRRWIRGPIGSKYLVLRARSQRGKGGVYEAVEIFASPPRFVILKQGRRHGEPDWSGRDGRARIAHETAVLRELHRGGLPVPRVLRAFSQAGDRYIVLERCLGAPIIPAARLHPARYSPEEARTILDQLEPLLTRIHACGWVWRDCKPHHVWRRREQLQLLDFEGACRIEETNHWPWGSAGYLPPELAGQSSRPAGTLEDEYALGVIAFQFLAGRFPPSSRTERLRMYRATNCPFSLQRRIERLLC